MRTQDHISKQPTVSQNPPAGGEVVTYSLAPPALSVPCACRRQRGGNALLLGVGGSGRKSLTRLATFMADYFLYTIEIAKGYGMVEWRDDLRRCLLQAGVKDQPTAFVFSDAPHVHALRHALQCLEPPRR